MSGDRSSTPEVRGSYEWPTFAIGQRVKRRQDVYDQSSPFMFGHVTGVMDDDGLAIYSVLWDGFDVPSHGYLPWGISEQSDDRGGPDGEA